MTKEEKELMVEKIRTQYEEKNEAEKAVDRLRKLDAKAKRPANMFAYSFGTLGSLVMGTGMSMAMDVFGKNKRIPGVVIGSLGMAMMIGNYPIYKKMVASRKAQYSKEILELSEEIMAEEE